jgi:UDP-glucuronate decarboxylase
MTVGDKSINKVFNFPVRQRGQKKTIVITGGAGFLGSQLCERKLLKGHRVVCIDNLLSGRMINIASFQSDKNFNFVEHDVINPYDVTGHVDEIYNMACAASPPKYQIDPIHTFKTNVFGALNALELARKKNARIFQASTSEVYGDPLISPQPEGYKGNVNIHGPRACYDEGKRSAETLFYDFSVRYGVDIRIARIFNTYGPHMDPFDGRVVSNFIMQAIQSQDISIYGNGDQTRSFCYVDDLLDGIEKLMASREVIADPVNIGNPVEFTVRELAQLVLKHTRSKSKITHTDLPVDDPRQRRPDIALAKKALDWVPTISLQQGLEKTIPYFSAELERMSANGIMAMS